MDDNTAAVISLSVVADDDDVDVLSVMQLLPSLCASLGC
jgi:hypothetical protein